MRTREEELDLTPRSAQQRTDRISSASQYFGIPSSRAAMAISAKCLSYRITAMVIYLIISAINSTTNACVMQLLLAVKKPASREENVGSLQHGAFAVTRSRSLFPHLVAHTNRPPAPCLLGGGSAAAHRPFYI